MNFTKFTGKHLRQSLFFNKVAGLTFFTEYLRATSSGSARIMQLNMQPCYIKYTTWLYKMHSLTIYTQLYLYG